MAATVSAAHSSVRRRHAPANVRREGRFAENAQMNHMIRFSTGMDERISVPIHPMTLTFL